MLITVGPAAPVTCRIHPSNSPKLVLKAQVPSGEVVCGLSEITVNNSAEPLGLNTMPSSDDKPRYTA